MNPPSILNNVLGPIMPGPSSSHTAGPYHIGRMSRSLLGESPKKVTFTFAPGSSIAEVYQEEGSDLALIMGILGRSLTDAQFRDARKLLSRSGISVDFHVAPFEEADHPNSIKIEGESSWGGTLKAIAKSTGGGAVVFTFLEHWHTHLTGDKYHILVEADSIMGEELTNTWSLLWGRPVKESQMSHTLLCFHASHAPTPQDLEKLKERPGIHRVWYCPPVLYPHKGKPLFKSAREMLHFAAERAISLGEAALEYEAALLGTEKVILNRAMEERLKIMEQSVALGLSNQASPMILLESSAHKIWKAQDEGKLPLGGVHLRAATRAMATMEVNSSNGIVCAAPTGGSAGVLPGIMVTLMEDLHMEREKVIQALWTAGAVGLILAIRGTFAAEVAGCQVEIGAAGAMGAGAVAEIFGGTPQQVTDSASLVFHNAMGLVCDLVQSVVEIPCHTRNASFASQAFLCAELVLGGYHNSIALDDTIDAVYNVGRGLPKELLCTSQGGLGATPSARSMKKQR